MLSQSSSDCEAWIFIFYFYFFCFISCWQSVLIVVIPVLINNDVFELSYSDLKFIVQNRSYFCTNLMKLQYFGDLM